MTFLYSEMELFKAYLSSLVIREGKHVLSVALTRQALKTQSDQLRKTYACLPISKRRIAEGW